MDGEQLKKVAAQAAAAEVTGGSVVGLGTGSTANYAVRHIAERMRDEGLVITGIPTSKATATLAEELGIPLGTLEDYPEVDIAIDGADQVGSSFNLVKGGGGAHVREKIVASAAKRFLVIVDETKIVQELSFPIPVEIVPFSLGLVIRRLQQLACVPHLRVSGGGPFISDNGNFVIDADFGVVAEPAKIEREINLIPGVVDNGIFTGLASEIYVGTASGVRVLRR